MNRLAFVLFFMCYFVRNQTLARLLEVEKDFEKLRFMSLLVLTWNYLRTDMAI